MPCWKHWEKQNRLFLYKEGKEACPTSIILYARKSVERENSISCETQLEYCKMMIKPDEKTEAVIELLDNGFSGGNMERDGFQTMMKLVRQGKIRKVIVYKLDRISRSLSDFVNMMQEFKAHQVEFVSSQESFDSSSPYGELIMKILMVFAEFERASIINRVTQAYHHRSEMGFYMGGRRPYGFELAPTVIHNIPTKKLSPVPEEQEQLRYLFEVYGQGNISLRRLMALLIAEGKNPRDGSHWTTAKLSTILKNPIYVKADADVYSYYEGHGVQIVSDLALFRGECGAQLYGHSKHKATEAHWSDRKLVLLTHQGIIDSATWLKCQRKLEQNRQIGKCSSSQRSWLSGKVTCEQCGQTMFVIKGKADKKGHIRRYFQCSGRSHKKICSGPKGSVYAEDLEKMIADCIAEKLSSLPCRPRAAKRSNTAEINDLKLKIKAIAGQEKQLMDALLSDSFNEDLLLLANQKAAQLKQEKLSLLEKLEEAQCCENSPSAFDLANAWQHADYERKKAVANLLIHQIIINEDNSVKVFWNI